MVANILKQNILLNYNTLILHLVFILYCITKLKPVEEGDFVPFFKLKITET